MSTARLHVCARVSRPAGGSRPALPRASQAVSVASGKLALLCAPQLWSARSAGDHPGAHVATLHRTFSRPALARELSMDAAPTLPISVSVRSPMLTLTKPGEQAGRPRDQQLVHGQELLRLGPEPGGAARLALRRHHLQGNIPPLPAAPAWCEAAAWQDPWEVVPHTHLSLHTWMPCLQISCRSLKFTYNSQVDTLRFHSPLQACAEQQGILIGHAGSQ